MTYQAHRHREPESHLADYLAQGRRILASASTGRPDGRAGPTERRWTPTPSRCAGSPCPTRCWPAWAERPRPFGQRILRPMGMPIARAAVEARPRRAPRPDARTRGAPADGGHALAAMRRLAADLGLETGDLLGATVLHEVTHRVLARHGAGRAHPLASARSTAAGPRRRRARRGRHAAGVPPGLPHRVAAPRPGRRRGCCGGPDGSRSRPRGAGACSASTPRTRPCRACAGSSTTPSWPPRPTTCASWRRWMRRRRRPPPARAAARPGRRRPDARPRPHAPAARPDRRLARLPRRAAAVGPSPLGVRADPGGPPPPHAGAGPPGGRGARAQPARA